MTDAASPSLRATHLLALLLVASPLLARGGDGAGGGSLEMTVVAAELETIAGVLDDAYTGALASGMTMEPGERVGTALEDCSSALDAGHALDLQACIQKLQTESATDPTDRALLAVLGVIALRAGLLLNL